MSIAENLTHDEFALVLAAHGSSKAEWNNRPLLQLAVELDRELPTVNVTAAFLDGEPDIRTVLQSVQQSRVLVIPFMASQGYYSNIVFPKHLSCKSKEITFAQAIGHHPKLADLVSQRIQTIAKQNSTAHQVAVVGHGTKKNKASCLTTINLVKELRLLHPGTKIDFAFIDQNPGLNWYVNRVTSESILVMPFLMGLGPHTTSDVPEALGMGDLTREVLDCDFEFPIQKTVFLNNKNRHVIFDQPVGTYVGLREICMSHVSEFVAKNLTTEESAR